MFDSADANLRFAFLAYEKDFVDVPSLTAALRLAMVDPAKNLGQILVQRGKLTSEQCRRLETIAQEALPAKSSDFHQRLRAVFPEIYQQLVGADQEATRVEEISAHSADDLAPSAVQSSVSVDAISRPGLRYRKDNEPHARGGLGAVFKAKDEELNRLVALKEIRDDLAELHQSRRRFMREAEITGRLEHPGVVPVYGLGQYPDGRPWYVMRFIQGESLKEAIERFHAADQGGTDAGERRLALRQLLANFVAVCKTMAYAHSRGVLHRDLKPANVMLGKYGETLVVDWGLARSFERDEAARSLGEESLQPGLPGGDGETQVGELVGTPAYCSPEQASGHWDVVGPASDIFSLGATLYNLLTNRIPYAGSGALEIIDQVNKGALIPPRQQKQDVPRPLEAICLKAMARQREERYGSALELAGDVEHWLADEPVSAHRESVLERLARIRRRFRALGVAAGSLVFAVVSLAIAVVLANSHKAERLAKNEAQQRLEQMAKGTDILGSIFAGLDPGAVDRQGKPLAEILGQRVELAAQQLQGESVADALTVAKLQNILGESLIGLGRYSAAVALLEKCSATRAAELGENDLDTLTSRNNLALAYQAAGRLDRAIPLFQSTLKAREAKLGDDHPQTLTSRNNLAHAYRDAGQLDLAIPLAERTLKVQEGKLGDNHPDTLTSRNNVANAYLAAGKANLAIPLLQRALKAREAKLGDNHPQTLISRNNLARAVQAAGQVPKAIRLFQRTLNVQEAKLGDEHPDTLTTRNDLALAYQAAGQLDRALPLFEDVLDQAQHTLELGVANPLTMRFAENYLAALEAKQQYTKAITERQNELIVQRKVFGSDDPRLAAALVQLGSTHLAANQPADAERAFREGLAIRSKKEPDAWTTFNTKSLLGAALLGEKKYAEAEPLLLDGYEGMKKRQAKIPPQSKIRLTEALEGLVKFYEATGKKDEAAKWRRELDAAKAANKQP
jgi:tRNA A-37 threonylcarbamoyl transferase component Bud32